MSVPCTEMVTTGATRTSTTIGIIAASHGIGAITMTVRTTGGATLVLRLRLNGDVVTTSEMLKRKEKKRKT